MNEERILQNLNDAFHNGGHFDKIVVALAKAIAERPLNAEDQGALSKAIEFMEKAKLGFQWVEKPSVSEESKNCASSFQIAAQCIKEKSEPAKFILELDSMKSTLESLQSGKKARKSALRQAADFFDDAFQASIERIDSALHTKQIPRNGKWAMSSAI